MSSGTKITMDNGMFLRNAGMSDALFSTNLAPLIDIYEKQRVCDNSISFDGATNAIAANSVLSAIHEKTFTSAGKNFTVRIIFKVLGSGQRNLFYAAGISTNGGMQIGINASNKINAIIWKNGSNLLNNNSTSLTIANNTWYDMLFTWDSTQASNPSKPKIWLRSFNQNFWSDAGGTWTQTGTCDFIVGTNTQVYLWGYNANWYSGNVLEAGTCWNKVLTSDERDLFLRESRIVRSDQVAPENLQCFSVADSTKIVVVGTGGSVGACYLQDTLIENGYWVSGYPSYGIKGVNAITYETPKI